MDPRDLQDFKTPFDYGAVGDGLKDDTTAVQNFVSAGGGYLPANTTFAVMDTIVIPANTTIRGAGKFSGSKIKLNLASGAAVRPLMVTSPAATNICLYGFELDHNASGLSNPTIGGGDVAYGSCLMIISSNTNLDSLVVTNGWDNGIFVTNYDYPNPNSFTTTPMYVSVMNCLTSGAGCGYHQPSSDGGQIGYSGTGIDVATALFVIVESCIDNGSYSGFGTDTGGQTAFVQFSNCISYNCQRDMTNLSNGSGNAFTHQANQSSFIGCKAYSSQYRSFWAPNSDTNSLIISGCSSDLAGGNGFEISTSNALIVGCQSRNSGNLLDNSANFAVISTDADIINTVFNGCSSIVNSAARPTDFGYRETPGSQNESHPAPYNITCYVQVEASGAGTSNFSYGATSTVVGDQDNAYVIATGKPTITVATPLQLPSYNKAQLATPGTTGYVDPELHPQCIVLVADNDDVLAKSDGGTWRYVDGNAIVTSP